jgi:hypothetical protein
LKYKRCCLPDASHSARAAEPAELRPLETLDATDGGCHWTIYTRTESSASLVDELVEHACDGERLEVDRQRGWLRNGKPGFDAVGARRHPTTAERLGTQNRP